MEELKAGWRRVRLGDVIESISDTTKIIEDEVVLINTSDVYDGKVLNHQLVENKGLKGQFKKRFKYGDILYSEIRPINRRFAKIKFDSTNYLASTKLMILRKKENALIDEEYIYQLLKSDKIISELQQIAESRSGTFPQITFNELKTLEFFLPSLETQKKIVSILSLLDEKIELNRKINQNLEETAQTLFKRWFIDFEFPNEEGKPYKSSGGKMIESELGEIPEGWRVGKLGDFIKFIKGKKPKILVEKEDEINKFKYLTIKSINNEEENYCSEEKVIFVSKNEIMMVMDGASSGDIYIGKEGILGSTLSKIEIEKSIDWSIIYCLLNYYKNEIKQHNTGSAIPHTDKNYIENITFFLPNNGKINYFSKIFKRILLKKIVLEDEVYKLIELRDYLLPRLMSGEITV